MTEVLTGRELDVAVALALGIRPWPGRPGAFCAPIVPRGVTPKPCDPPAYSAADCSGLAPVLAWWAEQDVFWRADYDPSLPGLWWTAALTKGRHKLFARGTTLPECACRLLIAWASQPKGKP